MTRYLAITDKVPTPFGKCYTHVSYDSETKRIQEITISLPGKHDGNEVDTAIDALVTSINDSIGELI